MALARCEKCGRPTGLRNEYIRLAPAVGYPDTGLLCGRPTCINPAIVWLTVAESNLYRNGHRLFALSTRAKEVRLQDGGECVDDNSFMRPR